MGRGGVRNGAGRPQTNPKEALENVLRVTNSEKEFILFARGKKLDLRQIIKTLSALLLLVFLNMPANAMVLEARVEYTVDSARVVAFDNTELRIPKSEFYNDRYDPNFYNNTLGCIRSGITHDDFKRPRKIVPFYENNKLAFYGVQYDDMPAKKYYYSPTGILLKYEISNFTGAYPYKTMAYDTKGKLLNINLVVSATESYLFNANKDLIGHWINNQFYDANSNKDISRRL